MVTIDSIFLTVTFNLVIKHSSDKDTQIRQILFSDERIILKRAHQNVLENSLHCIQISLTDFYMAFV